MLVSRGRTRRRATRIDMLQPGSIHLRHFVFRGPGRSWPAQALRWALPCLALLVLGACARRGASRPVEDTETSGRISIVTSTELHPLVAEEVAAFRSAYSDATLEFVEPQPSGQLVSQLLAGRADVVVLARELEQEERDMARAGGIEVEGHRIAQDALCVVVAANNPVRNVTVGEIQRIWSGEIRDWAVLGGPAQRIVPVLPPLSSDRARAFAQRVMAGAPLRAASLMEPSDSAVATRVSATPGAIGVVPLALANVEGVRPLHVAAVEGTPYVEPDMETVHEATYPLTHPVNLYLRIRRPRLAGGFVTFVTSQPGQELVLASGRVPTSVPLRFVRRSPMLGSH
jgi:phosphate transport system substrate-binding protein